jgi:hypothetical protein
MCVIIYFIHLNLTLSFPKKKKELSLCRTIKREKKSNQTDADYFSIFFLLIFSKVLFVLCNTVNNITHQKRIQLEL